MLNLDGFSGRPLQNVLQFLRYAEGKGITDTRVMQTIIEETIRQRTMNGRVAMSKEGQLAAYRKKRAYKNNKELAEQIYEKCPSCKNGLYKPKKKIGKNEVLFSCRRENDTMGCGYSQIVEIGNV